MPLLEEEFLDPTFKIKLEAINTPHRRSTSFSTMRKKKKYTRTSTTHF